MASGGKKKTTMAKLMRESRLRERRQDKQARKDARKLAPASDPNAIDETLGDDETLSEDETPGEAGTLDEAEPAVAGAA